MQQQSFGFGMQNQGFSMHNSAASSRPGVEHFANCNITSRIDHFRAILKLKNDLVKVEEKMVKKLASSKPEKEEILATNKEKKTVGDSRIKQSEKGESNKKDYSRCPDATEVIKGENKRCPRCGEIFNKQIEMIAHVKEQHVNFANSVLHMAESKAWEKKPKTEEEQREFDYFKALAVKLKTADVC